MARELPSGLEFVRHGGILCRSRREAAGPARATLPCWPSCGASAGPVAECRAESISASVRTRPPQDTDGFSRTESVATGSETRNSSTNRATASAVFC